MKSVRPKYCRFFRILSALGILGFGFSQATAQVKLLMPLGDSITWGKVNRAAPPSGTSGYRKPLHDKLSVSGINTTFVGSDPDPADPDRGYFLDGGTIGDFLGADSLKGDMATVVSTYQPDIVILHLGTNNVDTTQLIGDYASPGTIMNQLYTLVTKITNNANVENLLLCKVIPNFTSPGLEQKTQDFNNAVEIMLTALTSEQAAKVTLIDMWTPFFANKNSYYNIDLDKIHPNATGYAAMADIFYYYISRLLQPYYVDEFDRVAIGTEWAFSPGLAIDNQGENGGGALKCTTTGSNDWAHVAIWKKTKKLTTVTMRLHSRSAGSDTTSKVGILVGLDSLNLRANGYLVWVYQNQVWIKTVVKGKAGYGIGDVVSHWPMNNLRPGDEFKVSYRQEVDANYFTMNVNNGASITLRDRYKLTGNSSDSLYAGIMFTQAETPPAFKVLIDRFRVDAQLPDVIAPGRIYDLREEFTTNTSVTLGWTAVGSDGETIGKASSYDLRFSTAPIENELDFSNANIVSGMPAPQDATTPEVFTVTGLQSGVGYYFCMRAIDNWGNKGELSIPSIFARTNSAGQEIETFNRPNDPDGTIGPEWVIDGNEYRIDYNATTKEGEFNNFQTDGNWGRVAVYKGRTNPSVVKLVWGRNATGDGIGQGGLALMLTAPNLNANGYLLWIRESLKKILLFNIVNGEVVAPPEGIVDEVAYTYRDRSGSIHYPQRGDTMAVVMDWNNPQGHKFDVYLNGGIAGERSLYDASMRHNSAVKYAGIMLGRRDRTNNVNDFITVSESTSPEGIEIYSGNAQSATVGTQLPDSLVVRVRDSNNTPISGIPVWFKVLEPPDALIAAPAEPADPLQIETEWGVFTGPYYVQNDDEAASGSKYIVSPIHAGEGQAKYVFAVEKDTTYYFWLRINSPDYSRYWALSFKLDNYESWLNGMLYKNPGVNRWQWDRIRNAQGQVVAVRLAKGLHTVTLISAHENFKVDKILLTSRANFIPTTMESVNMLLTNTEGTVRTALTLGTRAGLNRVRAKPFGTLNKVEITATGLPAAANNMIKSNDPQSGGARTTLPKPFTVTLYDQYGNKVPNTIVNFQVTEGDGQLSAARDTTDANGQASTTMTLGIQSTTNKVKATFAGYAGPEVVFTGTATTGLVRRIQGQPGTGVGVKHYVGDVLPNFIKAQVLDDQSLPVNNVPVTFQVVAGSGSPGRLQPKSTNSLGVVQDTLRLGNAAGIVKVLGKVSNVQDTVARDSVFYKATRLAYFSGDRQTARVSDTLAFRIKVKVLDKTGQAVASQPVTFLTKGNGFHFPGPGLPDSIVVTTNSSGLAGTNVRTGELHGSYANIVEARCSDGFRFVQGSPVFFSINAKSEASRLIKVQGDSVEGVVREMLPEPLIVKMVDAKNNPVAGQPVDFNIRAGGGQFEGTLLPTRRIFTDGDGLAMVYYSLGTASGSYNNIVEAAATNGVVALYGSPILFRISAKSSAADSIAAVSSTLLSGTVGKALSPVIQAKVFDRHGNPVNGEEVRFSVLGGGGALNGTADTIKVIRIDNAGGIASVTWTLGTKAGVQNNILEASADNGLLALRGSPVHFVASALADSVSVLQSRIEATGPVHATENDTSKITVNLLDRFGNPVAGKRVHLEVTGGSRNFPQDPTQPTDTQGKAKGYLRSLTSGVKTVRATVVDDGKLLASAATVIFLTNDASRIQAHGGGGQTGNVGTLLRDSLVVKITDSNENPVSFGPVHFEVAGGGGSIYGNTDAVSDSFGLAWAKLILGPEPGENVVRVTSDELQGSPLYFTATGKRGEPVAMRSVSGSGQRGAAGEPLLEPFIVQVVDRTLGPVAGVPVQFAVTLGSGQLITPQPASTDAFGQAQASLRVDEQSGQTTWVEARNTSLSGSPQRFSAISTAGPARKIRMVSGNRQSGFVGEALRNPLSVQTTDKYGNSVGGVPVRFQVVSGGASLSGNPSILVTSDPAGMASASVTLSQETGASIIEATSAYLEGSPITFTAFAQSVMATNIEKFGGDNQKGRLGQLLVDPLMVVVLDQYGNRVPATSVYFTMESGGGSIVDPQPVVSDSNGIASVWFIAASSPGKSYVSALWADKIVTFTVEAVVDPNNPVLDKNIIAPSYDVYEKDDLIIPLVAQDADNDPLTFQIANLFPPEGAVIQRQSASTAVFRWTPTYDQQGSYTVVLRVVDGRGGVDADTVGILVRNLNREPEILSTVPVRDDTLATAGQKQSFLVNARDKDGDALHFIWQVDGFTAGGDLPFLEYTFDRYVSGAHTVDCFVSDGFVSVSHRWRLNVKQSVELASIAAVFDEDPMKVTVQWVTTRETGNAGFEVIRSLSAEGTYKTITEGLIPSQNGGTYAFEDTTVLAGRTYYYKLVDVDTRGNRREHGPVSAVVPVPKVFELVQNFPNPFNPLTTIRYHLPIRGRVTLAVFNTLGQRVRILADREHEAGYFTARWDGLDQDGREAPTGVYIALLKAPSGHRTMKMVKLK